ncbi:hypothetical protein [Novosphingobium sp.]|uniref:hypothetical protein n=1 Tax=Novosphingobium sp. TaxID=1874826 RepID=UPI0033418CC9
MALLAATTDAGFAQDLAMHPAPAPIEVTAGQEFYSKTLATDVQAYRLGQPFKSSMPGSMGFPFNFAIDSDMLVRSYVSATGWVYFVPPDHMFRAWHSLLGSVIRGRDSVGLRVGPAGQMEWFVDNASYTRSNTVWTRPLRPTDPVPTPFAPANGAQSGGSGERLIYMGLTEGNRARVRFEKNTPGDALHDTFTFPLDQDGKGNGAIDGIEFSMETTPTHAKITVLNAPVSHTGGPPRQ